MAKLTNKQTVYVTLPKKDYIESASEKIDIDGDDDKSWFEKLIDKILNRESQLQFSILYKIKSDQ